MSHVSVESYVPSWTKPQGAMGSVSECVENSSLQAVIRAGKLHM